MLRVGNIILGIVRREKLKLKSWFIDREDPPGTKMPGSRHHALHRPAPIRSAWCILRSVLPRPFRKQSPLLDLMIRCREISHPRLIFNQIFLSESNSIIGHPKSFWQLLSVDVYLADDRSDARDGSGIGCGGYLASTATLRVFECNCAIIR